MSLYVFLDSEALDVKVLVAARKAAQSRGATVVKSLAGTMLLKLAPAQVTEVARALPCWRHSVERKTTRVPEQTSGAHQGTGRAGDGRQGIDQGLRRIGGAEDCTTLPPIKLMSTDMVANLSGPPD